VLNAMPSSFFLIWSPKRYLVTRTEHKAPYISFQTFAVVHICSFLPFGWLPGVLL
jgi:hypothetical protein